MTSENVKRGPIVFLDLENEKTPSSGEANSVARQERYQTSRSSQFQSIVANFLDDNLPTYSFTKNHAQWTFCCRRKSWNS
jgi:hypothetical protein